MSARDADMQLIPALLEQPQGFDLGCRVISHSTSTPAMSVMQAAALSLASHSHSARRCSHF